MQLDPAGTAQPDRKAWHHCAVPVVIFLVAAVILGGIVVVAMGRGGELAREKVELPATGDLRSWSGVARYRPPPALLGYHAAATEQALMIIARSIAERDAEISWLRSRLAELQPESAGRGGDVTGAAGADDLARDSNDGASTDDDRAGADDDRAGADLDRAGADDDRAATNDDRASTDDDRAAISDDRAGADDDLAAANDDRAAIDDDRAGTGDDGARTAPASASASENGPDPEGSQTAAVAEPPVQTGYWPQAGPVTHD
jgi:hypothetical protein